MRTPARDPRRQAHAAGIADRRRADCAIPRRALPAGQCRPGGRCRRSAAEQEHAADSAGQGHGRKTGASDCGPDGARRQRVGGFGIAEPLPHDVDARPVAVGGSGGGADRAPDQQRFAPGSGGAGRRRRAGGQRRRAGLLRQPVAGAGRLPSRRPRSRRPRHRARRSTPWRARTPRTRSARRRPGDAIAAEVRRDQPVARADGGGDGRDQRARATRSPRSSRSSTRSPSRPTSWR